MHPDPRVSNETKVSEIAQCSQCLRDQPERWQKLVRKDEKRQIKSENQGPDSHRFLRTAEDGSGPQNRREGVLREMNAAVQDTFCLETADVGHQAEMVQIFGI